MLDLAPVTAEHGAMRIPRLAALAAALIFGWQAAMAAPAAWYQWRSKLNGTLACSQTPLGEGWEKASGPYRDARCEKPIVVK